MSGVRLRDYDNSWYSPGRSVLWRSLWFFVGLPLFGSRLVPGSRARVALLRSFGATVGDRVVIRHDGNVKYPWHLVVGDDCWIGEGAWIDNLTTVRIGNNCCISQGAYFCTGNHDWSDPRFGLRIAPIELKDSSWAGAKSVLLPGTVLEEGAIAAAGSVVSGTVPSFAIFAGNPAIHVKQRIVRGLAEFETEPLERHVAV